MSERCVGSQYHSFIIMDVGAGIIRLAQPKALGKSAVFSVLFYFALTIKPKEASDSDFTIEDIMLWPGMRFSLRSQCKRCSAGRLQVLPALRFSREFGLVFRGFAAFF